jgi:hypothetical protein
MTHTVVFFDDIFSCLSVVSCYVPFVHVSIIFILHLEVVVLLMLLNEFKIDILFKLRASAQYI